MVGARTFIGFQRYLINFKRKRFAIRGVHQLATKQTMLESSTAYVAVNNYTGIHEIDILENIEIFRVLYPLPLLLLQTMNTCKITSADCVYVLDHTELQHKHSKCKRKNRETK